MFCGTAEAQNMNISWEFIHLYYTEVFIIVKLYSINHSTVAEPSQEMSSYFAESADVKLLEYWPHFHIIDNSGNEVPCAAAGKAGVSMIGFLWQLATKLMNLQGLLYCVSLARLCRVWDGHVRWLANQNYAQLCMYPLHQTLMSLPSQFGYSIIQILITMGS